MDKTVIKRFDNPDEVRVFEKGTFEILRLGRMVIGRATYEPGWVWSQHVGSATGQQICRVEHVGQVVCGHAKVKMDDGSEFDLLPGDCFYIPPDHYSWVEGDEPYVSLHFMGAEDYAH